jgi:hypothetical protein
MQRFTLEWYHNMPREQSATGSTASAAVSPPFTTHYEQASFICTGYMMVDGNPFTVFDRTQSTSTVMRMPTESLTKQNLQTEKELNKPWRWMTNYTVLKGIAGNKTSDSLSEKNKPGKVTPVL